jgi:hypothetical protein
MNTDLKKNKKGRVCALSNRYNNRKTYTGGATARNNNNGIRNGNKVRLRVSGQTFSVPMVPGLKN